MLAYVFSAMISRKDDPHPSSFGYFRGALYIGCCYRNPTITYSHVQCKSLLGRCPVRIELYVVKH